MQRLHICFNAWTALLLACSPLWSATVSGSIDVQTGSKEAHDRRDRSNDIVIWLEPVHGISALPVQSQHAQLVQKNKMFHPHVLPITVGTSVDFPNEDPIFHNAFSNYDGQPFDVALYPPGTSRTVRFRQAGIVRVFCNIHPSMSAVIVVLNTPYFTKGSEGQYQIRNVPPGDYKLNFFDERATRDPLSPTVISVGQEETQVTGPVIHISEAGYLQLPHKNKYGLDYPPGADAQGYGGPPR